MMRGEIQQGGGSFRNRFGDSLYRENDGDFQINEGERGEEGEGEVKWRWIIPAGIASGWGICGVRGGCELTGEGSWHKFPDARRSFCDRGEKKVPGGGARWSMCGAELNHGVKRSLLFAGILAMGMILWWGCAANCGAEEPVAEAPRPSVLVMHSREVLEGIAVRDGGVYRVQTHQGELVVAASNVMLVCGSVEEAYLELKSGINPQNPVDHVSLAQWCVQQQLMEEARGELEEAVRLNPMNSENRILLQRVEDLMNPLRSQIKRGQIHRERFDLAAGALQKVEPLGGMSRDQAKEFTSRVQPILLNGCATAGCHRPGNPTGFTLEPLHDRFQSMSTTRKNFDAIRGLVDQENPGQSQLLTVHRGGASRVQSPFDKPQGEATERAVLRWIHSLGNPEAEEEVPSVVGNPRDASILTAISRDRQRKERRMQAAAKRRAATVKPLAETGKGFEEEFLSGLLEVEEFAHEGLNEEMGRWEEMTDDALKEEPVGDEVVNEAE